MGKEDSKPRYVKTKSGMILPIEVYTGIGKAKVTLGNLTATSLAAGLNPELVITEDELFRQTGETCKKNFETYKPILGALEKHGQLTLKEISKLTGRSPSEDGKYLEMLYGAGLVERAGSKYALSENAREDIKSTFGVVV